MTVLTILLILALVLTIGQAIMTDREFKAAKKREDALERAFGELEKAFIRQEKEICLLDDRVSSFDDMAKEALEAKTQADKRFEEGVRELMSYGKDIPSLRFGSDEDE